MRGLEIVVALGLAVIAGGTSVAQPAKQMHIGYDAEHLDLEHHMLQFKLTRPAGSASLVVILDDGTKLPATSATYHGEAAETWLSIGWTQPDGARVMKLQLRAVSSDEVATNLELIPWSVAIDHQEVEFATNSSTIEASEDAKLDASLGKIVEAIGRSEKYLKMQLYVAGHTDTVGTSASNRKLSLARARAIASYFKAKGLKIPIAFAGFGEDVLLVKTADETDERRNRRVDYVLGPVGGTPPFKGPYLKAHAEWKR